MIASLFLALAPSPSLAAVPVTDWYIDDDAAGPGTGSLADPFPTIQAALNAPTTLTGDRLLVQTGTYSDPFVVDGLSIDIAAAPGAGTVELLRNNFDQVLVTIQNVPAPGVLLEDLEIASVNPFQGSARLIEISGSHVSLQQCSILRTGTNFDSGAMKASGGSQVTMNSCLVADNEGGQYSSGLSFFDSTATIDDCEFRDNPGNSFSFEGGAIYFTGGAQHVLTLADCFFTGNSALDGSGAKISGQATAAVTDCEFVDNGDGVNNARGGALFGRGSVERCVFRHNYAQRGAVYGEWTIVDSLFEFNTGADDADYAAAVQGIGSTIITDSVIRHHFSSSSARCSAVLDATLVGCLLEDNQTYRPDSSSPYSGGAITDCIAIDCVFTGNGASAPTSPIPINPRGGAAVDSTLTRCIIVDNTAPEGGGVYRCELQNCTLVGNRADLAGAALDSDLNSCVVFENGPAPVAGGSTTYSNVQGGTSGLGNIDSNPLFWGPASRDLHLLAMSPCIDTGDPALTDPDGSRVDMGAFPYMAGYTGLPSPFCPTGEDGADCTPQLEAAAAPSLASGLALRATGMRDASLSLVFLSHSTNDLPYLNGNLCLGGSLRRGPVGILSLGAGTCGNTLDFPIPGASLSAAGFNPGDLFYAQVVYRDVIMGAAGISITSAIEARIEP